MGARVGLRDGRSDGEADGPRLGKAVGFIVGRLVGSRLGGAVGTRDGDGDGWRMVSGKDQITSTVNFLCIDNCNYLEGRRRTGNGPRGSRGFQGAVSG